MREAQGLTLEEAAWRGGMNWRHWQRIESGETSPTLRSLANLGHALGVDPSRLIAPPGEASATSGAAGSAS